MSPSPHQFSLALLVLRNCFHNATDADRRTIWHLVFGLGRAFRADAIRGPQPGVPARLLASDVEADAARVPQAAVDEVAPPAAGASAAAPAVQADAPPAHVPRAEAPSVRVPPAAIPSVQVARAPAVQVETVQENSVDPPAPAAPAAAAAAAPDVPVVVPAAPLAQAVPEDPVDPLEAVLDDVVAPISPLNDQERACIDVVLGAASAVPLGDQDPDLVAFTRQAIAAAGPGCPEAFARLFPEPAAINLNDPGARDDASVATHISISDSSSDSVSDASVAAEKLIAKQLTTAKDFRKAMRERCNFNAFGSGWGFPPCRQVNAMELLVIAANTFHPALSIDFGDCPVGLYGATTAKAVSQGPRFGIRALECDAPLHVIFTSRTFTPTGPVPADYRPTAPILLLIVLTVPAVPADRINTRQLTLRFLYAPPTSELRGGGIIFPSHKGNPFVVGDACIRNASKVAAAANESQSSNFASNLSGSDRQSFNFASNLSTYLAPLNKYARGQFDLKSVYILYARKPPVGPIEWPVIKKRPRPSLDKDLDKKPAAKKSAKKSGHRRSSHP